MDTAGTASPTGDGHRDGRQGIDRMGHRYRSEGRGRIGEIVT